MDTERRAEISPSQCSALRRISSGVDQQAPLDQFGKQGGHGRPFAGQLPRRRRLLQHLPEGFGDPGEKQGSREQQAQGEGLDAADLPIETAVSQKSVSELKSLFRR